MQKNTKKNDMNAKPIKARLYLLPILWMVSLLSLLPKKYKIYKENFKKIKGGCLVISNHMSFEDVKFLQRVIMPRRSFYVVSTDEFIGKEWLLRRLGCIPKKVHYLDLSLVRNLVRLLKKGNVVSLYPEATYSFAGIENRIDQSIGKMIKLANVPVVVIHEKGNYLYSPRWNTLPKNKNVPVVINAKMVVKKEEISSLTDKEIQERINEYFKYDEYQYQRENNIHIFNKTMAKNIDRILYRCPNCNTEKKIVGDGNSIYCNCCNSRYDIDELSILKNANGDTKFDSISKWYIWQKESVEETINSGSYDITFPVKISRLINWKEGFDHNFATGKARQTDKGIVIDGTINETKEHFHYEYNEKKNQTIHLTYSVKGCQEPAFEVHDEKESYLIYPLDKTPIVKIRFAVEASSDKYIKSLE